MLLKSLSYMVAHHIFDKNTKGSFLCEICCLIKL